MNRTFTSFITLSLATLFIAGCGGDPRPAGMPRLYPASIIVTQEGAPLAGATVQMIAEDEANARWGPMGTTDASGVAMMRTNARYNGAPLGAYKVIVSKLEDTPHPHPEWAGLPESDPNHWRYVEIAQRLVPVEVVAPQYTSITDTPLRVEITAQGRTYEVAIGPRPAQR